MCMTSPKPVPTAAFPTTYTFTAADAGSHVFTVYYPVIFQNAYSLAIVAS